jgi:hypothetical protein
LAAFAVFLAALAWRRLRFAALLLPPATAYLVAQAKMPVKPAASAATMSGTTITAFIFPRSFLIT